MIGLEASRHFDQPPEAVWSLVADPERLTGWVPTATQALFSGQERVHLQGSRTAIPVTSTPT